MRCSFSYFIADISHAGMMQSSMYNDVKGGPCNSKNRISVCPTILLAVGHAVGHVRPTANSRGSRRALEDSAYMVSHYHIVQYFNNDFVEIN